MCYLYTVATFMRLDNSVTASSSETSATAYSSPNYKLPKRIKTAQRLSGNTNEDKEFGPFSQIESVSKESLSVTSHLFTPPDTQRKTERRLGETRLSGTSHQLTPPISQNKSNRRSISAEYFKPVTRPGSISITESPNEFDLPSLSESAFEVESTNHIEDLRQQFQSSPKVYKERKNKAVLYPGDFSSSISLLSVSDPDSVDEALDELRRKHRKGRVSVNSPLVSTAVRQEGREATRSHDESSRSQIIEQSVKGYNSPVTPVRKYKSPVTPVRKYNSPVRPARKYNSPVKPVSKYNSPVTPARKLPTYTGKYKFKKPSEIDRSLLYRHADSRAYKPGKLSGVQVSHPLRSDSTQNRVSKEDRLKQLIELKDWKTLANLATRLASGDACDL